MHLDEHTVRQYVAEAISAVGETYLVAWLNGIGGSDLFIPASQINTWGDASLLDERTVPAAGAVGIGVGLVSGPFTTISKVRLTMARRRDDTGGLVTGVSFNATANNYTIGTAVVFDEWDADTNDDLGRGSLDGADDQSIVCKTGGTFVCTLTLIGPVA